MASIASVAFWLVPYMISAARLHTPPSANNSDSKGPSLTAVVQTIEGPVRGVILPLDAPLQDQTNVYYGIPFAAPPVGENRFRPPQPVQPWSDVRLIHDHSTSCPNNFGRVNEDLQSFFWPKHLPKLPTEDKPEYGSEDCLYLDVYAPREETQHGSVPVVVHQFGGAFVANDNWNHGTYSGVRWTNFNGVVLVNANFRVGIFGHWASEATKVESGTSGNWGMLDQRSALQWVQRNIASFGGDPARVTLLGFSSGAFSANWHRFSPGSAGLFHSIVAEGMAPLNDWFYQPWKQATSFYRSLARMSGCSRSNELACLRNKTVLQLGSLLERNSKKLSLRKTAGKMLGNMLSRWGYDAVRDRTQDDVIGHLLASPGWPLLGHGPVVDGTDLGLPDSPSNLIRRGMVSNVSVLSQFEPNEGSFFVFVLGNNHPTKETGWPLSQEGAEEMVTWGLTGSRYHGVGRRRHNRRTNNQIDLASRVLELYPRVAGQSGSARFDKIITDSSFHCPNIRMARRLAELGMNNQFLSEWKYIVPQWPSRFLFGSSHGLAFTFYFSIPGVEQRVVWPGEQLRWGKEQDRMAAQMQCRVARMAHCGNPNRVCTHPPSCHFAGSDPTIDIGVDILPYQAGEPGRVVVDKKTAWEAFPKELLAKCKFWDRVTFGFVNSTYRAVGTVRQRQL